MKSVLTWLKSNPLTVIALVVVLASVGAFVWFLGQSAQLRADLAAQGKEPGKITRLIGQSVSLPPTQLGAPPIDRRVTFNEVNNQRLREIYADVTNQADSTLNAITRINQDGHRLLADGFFPTNTGGDPFRFRSLYFDALATLLGGPGPQAGFAEVTGIALPTLNAGLPLPDEMLQQRLSVIVQEGMQTYGENITEEQTAALEAEQRQRLLAMLTDHAGTLDIYADPRIGAMNAPNSQYPLSIRPWITTGTTPEPWQLWESQMELWVQQDIVLALRRANKIGEVVATDDSGNETTGNVLNGVAKRLLLCEVVPGYVGLHVTGEVGTLNPGAADPRGGRNSYTSDRRGSQRSAPGVRYPNPPESAPTAPGAAVPANYFFGPTARASNHVFDVRHIRLVLHADFEQLPQLYRAIGEVNYMTVVDQRITDVDEFDFASLGGSFLYGTGDIVQVELIVESLWLRSWLDQFMPDTVRTYLGSGDDADADVDF